MLFVRRNLKGGRGDDLQTSTGFGFSIIKSNRSHRAMTVGTETENSKEKREQRNKTQQRYEHNGKRNRKKIYLIKINHYSHSHRHGKPDELSSRWSQLNERGRAREKAI